MENEIIEVIRKNIATLVKLRNLRSLTQLANKSGLDPKTITGMMAADAMPNPRTKNLVKIARALKVEPWMLLVENFPFHMIKGKPLKKLSGPSYVVANAMEQESQMVKMIMMEAASQALSNVDNEQSAAIKDAQAQYLKSQIAP